MLLVIEQKLAYTCVTLKIEIHIMHACGILRASFHGVIIEFKGSAVTVLAMAYI